MNPSTWAVEMGPLHPAGATGERLKYGNECTPSLREGGVTHRPNSKPGDSNLGERTQPVHGDALASRFRSPDFIDRRHYDPCHTQLLPARLVSPNQAICQLQRIHRPRAIRATTACMRLSGRRAAGEQAIRSIGREFASRPNTAPGSAPQMAATGNAALLVRMACRAREAHA